MFARLSRTLAPGGRWIQRHAARAPPRPPPSALDEPVSWKYGRNRERLVLAHGRWRNAEHWGRPIRQLAKEGEVEGALQRLAEMTEVYRLRPAVSVYNAVLAAMGRERRFNAAFKLFQQMKKRGLEPDAYTYTALLTACADARGNQPAAAVRLLEEMRERGVPPGVMGYNAAIAVAAADGDGERALELLEMLAADGERPDRRTYAGLLRAIEESGDVDAAEEVLEALRGERGTGVDWWVATACWP